MYAIIETGGKQVKATIGEAIYVEKVEAEAGQTFTFNKVLLVSGDKLTVGNPYVLGATVTAKVEKQGRAKKVIVYHYRDKKNEHKKQGHRQAYTKLVVESINL